MSYQNFTIHCTLTFFHHKRKTRPHLGNGSYQPQLKIKGTDDYLGVEFIAGELVIFNMPIKASALPIYEDVDYSSLTVGVDFFIIEEGHTVGIGTVDKIFYHRKIS